MKKEQLMNKETYETDFLKNNFNRLKCKKCGKQFWTKQKRDDCGEPPCSEYEFIGKPMTPKKYSLKEMRMKFVEFFESKNHTAVYRYPIVCRWKADTLFVGASIYDFMPWVVNGTIEPPANPLVISQPCCRTGDLDNIGLGTARHMSVFEMMAHHAFNYPNKEIYWKDETVKLCYEWLTSLGIAPGNIIFKENWWEGGGNAGPCFEVLVGGSEVATLVFMEYDGPVNGEYKPIPIKIVDTGYGLERHVWISQGTPTVYESVYPELIEWLEKKAKLEQPNKLVFSEFCKTCGSLDVNERNADEARKAIVKKISRDLEIKENDIMKMLIPYHNVYQIIDHSKALMFILGDGVVPSNVEEGYLARLLIRRAIRSLEDLGLEIPLREVVEKVIDYYKEDFPEFQKVKSDILTMIDVEEKKYKDTLKRGEQLVSGLEKIDEKTLVQLYESNGLLPRDIKKFTDLPMPNISDLETKMAVKKTVVEKEEEKKKHDVSGLPETELLYYNDQTQLEFKAKVLKVNGEVVVLDKTCFYPRGGGQEPDHGTMNGLKVYDIEKEGNVVLHFVEKPNFKKGDIVSGILDKKRRMQIMMHHTATHVINGAARKILGDHIWQTGSKKDEDKAHLDLTHYDMITPEQTKAIQDYANEIVRKKIKVQKLIMDRTSAEKDYGFRIYQGGAVPGKMLRITRVGDHDVEACGGLQVDNTGDIEEIFIFDVKRPQDGVIRLFYVAGRELIKKTKEEMIERTEKRKEYSDKKVKEFGEKKEEKKMIKDEVSRFKKETRPDFENKWRFFTKEFMWVSAEGLTIFSNGVKDKNDIILTYGEDKEKNINFAIAAGENVPIDVGEVAKEFGGGGSKNFSRGTVKSVDTVHKIRNKIMNLIK